LKSRPSVQLGRIFTLFIATLFLAGIGLCQSAAQTLRSFRTPTAHPPVSRFDRPLSRESLQDLPLQRLTPAQYEQWIAQSVRSLQAGNGTVAPPPTQPQYIDLTTRPRPPQVGDSTRAREIHPAWSWDQQYIFFASNNVDPVASYGNTQPSNTAPYHIYRMTSDGAFIQQITGNVQGETANDQLYPAINFAQTKLAYVHRTRSDQPYQLWVMDLGNNSRRQITGVSILNNPLNLDLVNVEHPSWHPGDNSIVFAARRKSQTGDVRNVYVVDINTRVVQKITNGTAQNGVESIDPVFHPSATTNAVAFASNASGVDPVTGDLVYTAKPRQDLRQDGSADDIDHDLFRLPMNGNITGRGGNITRLTTGTADDVEPAYQRSVTQTGQPRGSFNNWLAWASLGRNGSKTYDIYFNNGGAESTFNVPVRLFTPDSTNGAVPLDQSEERYPTWSSALPPQNPIDRIAFSSNRQNNPLDLRAPTVSPTDSDIWAAEVTDITPPTLFPIDEAVPELLKDYPERDFSFLQGQILHVANAPLPDQGRRIGVAGERFHFYAKLKDLQYGIDSVWLQIKDPDSANQDSAGREHKLYGHAQSAYPRAAVGGSLQNTFVARWINSPLVPSHYLHLAFETDFEGIGANDYLPYAGPLRTDSPAGNPFNLASVTQVRFASYDPGVDDAAAWSGRSFPPRAGQWLQMVDDGDQTKGDLKAGDGIYTAVWDSPAQPSDYYLDLIAYDKAFNPQNPTQQGNWIIYDNIWGFSTSPFISKNPALFVDDHGAGQKWPRGLKGRFRAFPTFRYGTESDILDRDRNHYPLEAEPTDRSTTPPTGPIRLAPLQDPDASFPRFAWPPNDPNATQFSEQYDFLTNDRVGYDFISWGRAGTPSRFGTSLRAYKADIWRLLARGPVPTEVAADYLPTRDEQPRDIQGNVTVQQPVPTRAIVWSAPYMGDIYLGAGSILDQRTQALLTEYRQRGGRLVVAGGDIMWALTVNGTVPQQFVQNTLGANYGGDESYGNWAANLNGPIAQAITKDAADPGFFNQQATPPWWREFYDIDPLGTQTNHGDFGTHPRQGPGNTEYTAANDATPFQTQDVVSPRAGWEMVFQDRMIANDDATTQSKTVFMSFSLASMGRRNVAENETSGLVTMNYRAKLSHAMFCWMFSAEATGQVRNLSGGAPISGAFVEFIQNGQVVGSAFTKADGTYTIRGLPVGSWAVRVRNPGFTAFFKADGTGGHGLTQATLDVFLSPAAPGTISGKVVDKFNQPVPNVRVKSVLRASPLYTGQREFTGITDEAGNYTILGTPVGDYDVAVDAVPDGFDKNKSTPLFAAPVTVLPAQDTPGINFELVGQPRAITARVFERLPDGTRGNPVANAEVSLLKPAGMLLPNPATQTTDANGVVVFQPEDINGDGTINENDEPVGPIQVSAFKFGFQEEVVSINVPQQQDVELLLKVAPARQLFGKAVRAVDGAVPTADDLTPDVDLRLLRGLTGLPVTGAGTARVQSVLNPGPPAHNYSFNAQEGTFFVELPDGHPRYFPAKVRVVIGPTGTAVAPDLLLVGRLPVFSGTVREQNQDGSTGVPIPNVAVLLTPQTGTGAGTVAYQTLTDANGDWTTPAGQLQSGLYTIEFRKFGHTTQRLTNVFGAGVTRVKPDPVLMLRAPRGRLYGLTRRATDGTPRPNVVIKFAPQGGLPSDERTTTSFDPPKPATEAPDQAAPFNYTIGSTDIKQEDLPEGRYTVTVTGDQRFAPYTGTVDVIGGRETRFNIDLTPLPGVVSGFVKENGNNNRGLAGASVAIRSTSAGAGSAPVVTVTTDANGFYFTPAPIPAGPYTVTATLFGFNPSSVDVHVEGPITAPDILMTRVPPSVVSGAVRSSVDGVFIPGVTIEAIPIAGGPATATTVSNTGGTPDAASNYSFSVPPVLGGYVIRATKPGWKVAQRTLVINPNVNYSRINFTLDPDKVFGRGLSLISLPDDFPNEDAADIFDKPRSSFRAASWNADTQSYQLYDPSDPIDPMFRLGRAAFVRFDQNTAFVKAGIPADPNTPFAIPVKEGWNMIGAVRRTRIEWLRVKVATTDGRLLTMQQAYDEGIIQNGLYGYLDGYFRSDYLEPFSGYFMRAFENCTLLVPVSNTSAALPASRLKTLASHGSPARGILAPATINEVAGPVPATSPINKAVNRRTRVSADIRTARPAPTSLATQLINRRSRRRDLG